MGHTIRYSNVMSQGIIGPSMPAVEVVAYIGSCGFCVYGRDRRKARENLVRVIERHRDCVLHEIDALLDALSNDKGSI